MIEATTTSTNDNLQTGHCIKYVSSSHFTI